MGSSIEETNDSTLLSEVAKNAENREKPEEHPLTVLTTACKGCVPSRIHVTDLCQGCVARPCESTCRFGAISVHDGKSHIDPEKCKNCGMCAQVCPYQAIQRIIVPCENACPAEELFINKNWFNAKSQPSKSKALLIGVGVGIAAIATIALKCLHGADKTVENSPSHVSKK